MLQTIESFCARRVCLARVSVSLWVALLSLGFAALVHPAVAAAQTTWVVSPAGNDNNPGTAAQPFLTIQHAADLVNPGDTVVVEDGTYTGNGAGTSCASNSRPIVCLARGGTSSARVTFRARNVGGARLSGQGNTSTDGFRFLSGANYVTIEGFELFGVGNASGSSSGFEMYNGGHDVVIAHNDIHDIGRLCTDTSNGQVGIFIEQPNVEVTGNRIHDVGRFVSGENGCATTYQASRDHGIYVDGGATPGANYALITNNVFFNNARGWSIQIYPGTVVGLSIVNNTFAFANPYQDGQIILGAATSNARMLNNIFYGPRNVAVNYYTGTQTNLQITNNLVFNAALLNKTPSGTFVSSNVTADPLLANTASLPFDFHLTASSPAIDIGVTVAGVSVDLDGNARSDGAYDVGAYEYGGAAPAPAPGPAPITPPAISPSGGSYADAVAVTMTDITPGATIHYTMDGTVPNSASPTYTGAFTLTSSATVNAVATVDGMPDSGVTSAAFQITSASPLAVSITSPADGSTLRRLVTIAASASGGTGGVASVRFDLDGRPIATDTSAPFAVSYNFNKVAAGAHVITAVATDRAGNSTSASITVWR